MNAMLKLFEEKKLKKVSKCNNKAMKCKQKIILSNLKERRNKHKYALF